MQVKLFHGTTSPGPIIKDGLHKSTVALYGNGYYFFKSKTPAALYGHTVLSFIVELGNVFDFSTNDQVTLWNTLFAKYKETSFPKKEIVNKLFSTYGYDSFKFYDNSRSKREYVAYVIKDRSQFYLLSRK